MRVAFQGERGAYSEEAIILRFGDSAEPVPRSYLAYVFDVVEDGEADLGLVPVENTLEGSVVRTYDLLNERPLKAVGEVVLKVSHCLIANKGVSKEEVKRVYSHPHALGQCREYLEKHEYEAVGAYDTAGSVRMLKEKEMMDAAAIASKRAAEIYDMAILECGIETDPENYTRFLVIGDKEQSPTGDDKTSIAFIVDHKPGTLHRSLGAFARNNINLTKIESRPLVGKPFEYVFLIDVEGHREEKEMRSALRELEENSRYVNVLGSYPKAKNINNGA